MRLLERTSASSCCAASDSDSLDRGPLVGDYARDAWALGDVEPLGRFLSVLGEEETGDGLHELHVNSLVALP